MKAASDASWIAPGSIRSPRLQAEDNRLRDDISATFAAGNEADFLKYLPSAIQGIITHYVDPDRRSRLQGPADNLRLVDDLGLDSLTMMEIMIRIEELFHISVSDEALRHFRTLGEVRVHIERIARHRLDPSSPLPSC